MTAPLRPHAARLNLVLKTIQKNPQCYDQRSWHCGTTHCFMGWAQVLAGKEANSDTVNADATKWLRLTNDEFQVLADGGNSLKRIKRLVKLFSSNEYYTLCRNFKGLNLREVISYGIEHATPSHDDDNDEE
jgi:hypothetical protein